MSRKQIIELVPGRDGWPDGIHDFLGTAMTNGEPSATWEQRRSRCFELACYAVALGAVPPNARLVHGSMQGPERDGHQPPRIAHAWVELPTPEGLLIWEPVHAIIYPGPAFTEFARLWDERTYTQPSVCKLMADSEHYGPWHETRYLSTKPGDAET